MKASKRFSLTALFLIFVSSGCGMLRWTTEEEKVYRDLIAWDFQGSTQSLYVIEEYTSVGLEYNKTLDTMLRPFKGEDFELTQDTIDDFIAKNSTPSQLVADMDLGIKYILLLQTEKDEMRKNQPDLELAIREKYPDSYGALLTLSQVGFNMERTQALIYFHERFAHSGTGNYCVFEKQKGNWVWKACIISWKED